MSQAYQALIVVSFGGPEAREDVMPFLENVLRGKNVPRARMEEVAEHYYHFDGVSPINEQNRQLLAAIKDELSSRGPRIPVYWGNRNWHPLLNDTVRQMANDGVRRALAFFTSAYSSYSGCRQYREDIARARASLGADAPRIDKLRAFYNHPGFIGPNVENLQKAYQKIPENRRARAPLVFTAHSIPLTMADNCDYVEQLEETASLIAERVGRTDDWELVYQSRSGPPHQPWLEPDVVDYIEAIYNEGVRDVVISPIGFISDHMEVLFDLDTELEEACEELGMNMVRAATVGTHRDFISMIRELIMERMNITANRRYLGNLGPARDFCPPGCCSLK